jgi:hypothetical protein
MLTIVHLDMRQSSQDLLVVVVALLLGAAGVALEIVLGSAAIHGLGKLF